MKRFIKLSGLLALVVVSVSFPAWADNAGQFTELEGQVTIRKTSGQSVQAVIGSVVHQGDLVMTARGGKATILFRDGSVLRLGPSTSLAINKLAYEEDEGIAVAAYEVARGTLMSIVGTLFESEGSDYQVTTPTPVSGVRGCIFLVRVEEDPGTGRTRTMAVGLEGLLLFAGSMSGSYELSPNQFSMSGNDGIATPPTEINQALLHELLASLTIARKSINQRASGLRKGGETRAPVVIITPQVIADLTSTGTTDGTEPDPQNLPVGDNPSDLIYQEPPQFTELIINVNVGGGP